jgi:hypothetical protein
LPGKEKIMTVVKKYLKKPVPIEAIQILWENKEEIEGFADVGLIEQANEAEWVCINEKGTPICHPNDLPVADTSHEIGMHIATMEGLMLGREGDYLIRGVHGELYSCKKHIFESTYSPYIADQMMVSYAKGITLDLEKKEKLRNGSWITDDGDGEGVEDV